MTLTNYWWLLIWLFVGGAIFGNMTKSRERLNGEVVERWNILAVILMVAPYIIWAGFRHDYFGDTALYRKTFFNTEATLSNIRAPFINGEKDPGYEAFVILAKSIIGNQDELFFLLIAAFQMLSVTLVFRRFSPNFWCSLFLFIVSTDYLSWMHNGMRQFIAVTIILAGFRYLLDKQYMKMILVIFVASLFHGSALIMIPIVFIAQGKAWDIKTVLMLIVTCVVVVSIDQFTPILNNMLQDTQYDDVMTNEIWTVDDGTNIIRVAVYSAPALLSLVGLKHIRAARNPIMDICVNFSIVTMAIYLVASVSSGIYIGRLPIYTTLQGYMAVPWIIDQIFEERSAKFVRYMIYVAYLAFFYYQMRFAWGAI